MKNPKTIALLGLACFLAFAFAFSAQAAEKDAAQETAAVPKPADSPPGYAELDATVSSLRFFESGKKQPPRGERIYRTNFSAAKTRFINWQLDLKYPKPKEKVDFTIEARCFYPNGELKYEQQMKTQIKPDWTKSWHGVGWGNQEPGRAWRPGRYRLELSVDGRVLAKGYFNVTEQEAAKGDAPAAKPAEGYKSLGAKISSLKFFEGPYDIPSRNERVYRTSFDPAKVRYLYWQVDFKYPEPGRRVEFGITTNCYNPDGSVRFSQITNSYTMPTWKTHWTTKGWGNKTPGKAWQPGRYRLELEVDGEKIAQGFFTMEDK